MKYSSSIAVSSYTVYMCSCVGNQKDEAMITKVVIHNDLEAP